MDPELDPLTRHFPVWDPCDLAAVVAAIRADLASGDDLAGGADRRSVPPLDGFLGAMEAWLAPYPLPHEDSGVCAEEVNGRFFAHALLAAASGGEMTSRWYASAGFDEI